MTERSPRPELEISQQTVRFFEVLLRAMADGVVVTDATQNIVLANEAFCAAFGRTRSDVLETSLFVWLEQLNSGAAERWAELEQRIRGGQLVRDVDFRLAAEGGERHLSVNAAQLERVGDEEVGVIVSVWRDVTEQRRTERALADRMAELETLQGELKRANTELKRKNSDLEEFTRVVGHDLRAPRSAR